MSVALAAIILIILLLPPVTFYELLVRGKADVLAHSLRKITLTEKLLGAALFALVIHAIAVTVISFYYEIRFDVLIALLGLDKWQSIPKGHSFYCSNSALQKYLLQFTAYNITLNALAAMAGYFLGKKLNNRLDFLNHRWFFIFKGQFNSLNIPLRNFKYDFVYVDAVVNTSDGTMIYTGRLLDYTSDEQNIDRMYLANVCRNEFKKTNQELIEKVTERITEASLPQTVERLKETSFARWPVNEPGDPISIPSDVFILKYDQILNLNLRFITISR